MRSLTVILNGAQRSEESAHKNNAAQPHEILRAYG
jgi:hypothetical protein